MRKKVSCRFPGCTNPPARGAYSMPLDPPEGKVKWGFVVLCAVHGERAILAGATKMSWRPKPNDERSA